MGAIAQIAAGKGVSIVLECEEFEEWLSEYTDGSLDGVSKELLEGHLRFCPRCADVLGKMRQLRQALYNLGGEGPSAAFQLQLNRRLGEARLRPRRFGRRTVRWGLAVAVAMALLLWPEPALWDHSKPVPAAQWNAPSSRRARELPRTYRPIRVGPIAPQAAVRAASF